MKNVLAVTAVLCLIIAAASVLSSWLTFGVSLAVSAGCVTALECLSYVERRRDEWRIGRERIWMQREGTR